MITHNYDLLMVCNRSGWPYTHLGGDLAPTQGCAVWNSQVER